MKGAGLLIGMPADPFGYLLLMEWFNVCIDASFLCTSGRLYVLDVG